VATFKRHLFTAATFIAVAFV